jgi:hypothetical protein
VASKKQVAANRQNAAKSTGPKSAQGKQVMRNGGGPRRGLIRLRMLCASGGTRGTVESGIRTKHDILDFSRMLAKG